MKSDVASRAKTKQAAARSAPAADVEALRADLEAAEQKKERAVKRATKALREENEELEAHLTHAVREIGQLRFVVDQVASLEKTVIEKDRRIAELEDEIRRLEGAVSSGRPTALAAAAAAGASRSRGFDALLGKPRNPGRSS